MAVRLMLAGFLLGIVHDRRLMREAQADLAIRRFIGCGLHERLPDHSSPARIRQRWGDARFRRIFERTASACVEAGIAQGEVVHVDATLVRADAGWESMVDRHAGAVAAENGDAEEDAAPPGGKRKKSQRDGSRRELGDQLPRPAPGAILQAAHGGRRRERRRSRCHGDHRRSQRAQRD